MTFSLAMSFLPFPGSLSVPDYKLFFALKASMNVVDILVLCVIDFMVGLSIKINSIIFLFNVSDTIMHELKKPHFLLNF